jgi:hypothetical protein
MRRTIVLSLVLTWWIVGFAFLGAAVARQSGGLPEWQAAIGGGLMGLCGGCVFLLYMVIAGPGRRLFGLSKPERTEAPTGLEKLGLILCLAVFGGGFSFMGGAMAEQNGEPF